MNQRLLTTVVLAACVAPAVRGQCLQFTDPGLANGPVFAFTSFDDGSGPALYVGGEFTQIGGVAAKGLAKWNGTTWSALPGELSAPHRVHALCVYDDDGGPELVVGGRFDGIDGVLVNNVARFDGTSWGAFGAGVINQDPLAGGLRCVESLAVYDDGLGGGPKLFAGGYITQSGNQSVQLLARYDGGVWTNVGAGLTWCEGNEDAVFALRVFDDGTGPALYAGGQFYVIEGGQLTGGLVARWNGVQQSAVGSLIGGSCVGAVHALEAQPTSLAGGGVLYAAGHMPLVAGGVASWNGASWSPIGTTVAGSGTALEFFDDGTNSGAQLFAAVALPSDGAAHLARWNGSTWIDEAVVTSGPSFPVSALYAYDDDDDGADLWIGGDFASIDGMPIAHLAKLEGCGGLGDIYCFGDGSLATACPCAPPDTVPNPSGASGAGCANSLNLAGATLRAFGATTPDTANLVARIATGYAGFGFLVKGDASAAAGIASHDGIRCASGALVRVGAHNAGTNGDPIGFWTYPNAVQTRAVSAATAQAYGEDAHYQLFYRNAQAGFCNPSTANFSNAVRVSWH